MATSTTNEKAIADDILSGSHDDIKINSALASHGDVLILSGQFNHDGDIVLPSGSKLLGLGSKVNGV